MLFSKKFLLVISIKLLIVNLTISQKSKFNTNYEIAANIENLIKKGNLEDISKSFRNSKIYKINESNFKKLSKEIVDLNPDSFYVSESNDAVSDDLHIIKVVFIRRKDNSPIAGFKLIFKLKDIGSKVDDIKFLSKENLKEDKLNIPPPPPPPSFPSKKN